MYNTKNWLTISDIFNDIEGGYNMPYKFIYDTYEHKGDFYIELMLPGFKKEDIKIDYDDKKINIKIERNKNEEFDYYKNNSFFGKATETFKIHFEPESIDAEFNEGVLRLKLKKKESNIPIIKFK